jgi:hypothetical protein
VAGPCPHHRELVDVRPTAKKQTSGRTPFAL